MKIMKKLKLLAILVTILSDISPLYANWIQKGPYRGVGNFNCVTFGAGNWYAGGTNGVFKSASSNPISWVQINSGISDTNVTSVCTFAYNVYVGTQSGIFRSNNSGYSWLPSNNGIPLNPCRVLYTWNNFIYAGTDLGLYSSSDTGQTRSPLNNGLPTTFITSVLAIPGLLFCGTNGSGLFRSSDLGQTWTDMNTTLPTGLNISDIKMDFQYLYISTDGNGLYRSGDSGITWQQINNGLQTSNINKISINQNKLFIATDAGIYISVDQGDSWTLNTQVGGAIRDMQFNLVAIVAASANYGLIKTNTMGSSWGIMTNGLPNLPHLMYFIKKIDSYLYAGSNDGLFISEDSAETWLQIKTDFLNDWNITSIISLGNNKMLCCANSTGFAGHIYYSNDNGFNWSLINLPFNGSYSRLSVKGTRIVAVGDGSGNFVNPIITSSDSGATWTPMSINGINSGSLGLFINDVFVFNDQISLVGVDQENIYRTTNIGGSWTNTNSGPNFPFHQFCYSDSVLYSTNGNQSSNLGVTWNNYFDVNNIDLIRSVKINSSIQIVGGSTFNFNPQVFMSNDQGMSWFNWSEGLTGTEWVNGIELDSANVYAAARGVFKRNVNDIVLNSEALSFVEEQFKVVYNSGSLNVYNNSNIEFSFKIYNQFGQILKDVTRGKNDCFINLPSGIYICQIAYKDIVRGIKFTVAR